MDENRLKKLAYLIIGSVVLILAYSVLIRFFSVGRIIVTTDGQNIITISDSNQKVLRQAAHSLDVTLHTGNYTASVHGKVISVNQSIVLGSRQTLRYRLNPPLVSNPEPVAAYAAHDIQTDSSDLFFVDDSNGLIHIGSQIPFEILTGGENLSNIQWSSTSYGVGQDGSGNLHVVANGSVRNLNSAGLPDKSSPSAFALTTNKRLYVLYGEDLYYGGEDQPFRKIFTTSSASILKASTDKVLIASGQLDKSKSYPSASLKLTVIDNKGAVLGNSTMPVSDDRRTPTAVSWSPDGTKLIISNIDTSGTIFSSSLQKITTLPNTDVVAFKWLSNDKLLYSVNNIMWLYDYTSKNSVVVANLPPGNTINEITLSQGDSYAYFATSSDSGGEIYRVGLKGQKAEDYIYQLGVFLPLNLDQCSVNFVNFVVGTKPIIVLRPSTTASTASCQQSASAALQKDGLDLSKLRFYNGPLYSYTD